jgi:hypothetical protein
LPVLNTFWQFFAEHMSCWHPYFAVGVSADAIGVHSVDGVLAVARIPSDSGTPILAGGFTY